VQDVRAIIVHAMCFLICWQQSPLSQPVLLLVLRPAVCSTVTTTDGCVCCGNLAFEANQFLGNCNIDVLVTMKMSVLAVVLVLEWKNMQQMLGGIGIGAKMALVHCFVLDSFCEDQKNHSGKVIIKVGHRGAAKGVKSVGLDGQVQKQDILSCWQNKIIVVNDS